jgi:hypothetical protein
MQWLRYASAMLVAYCKVVAIAPSTRRSSAPFVPVAQYLPVATAHWTPVSVVSLKILKTFLCIIVEHACHQLAAAGCSVLSVSSAGFCCVHRMPHMIRHAEQWWPTWQS